MLTLLQSRTNCVRTWVFPGTCKQFRKETQENVPVTAPGEKVERPGMGSEGGGLCDLPSCNLVQFVRCTWVTCSNTK